MKSPFTDKEMELKVENRSITFRKEKFEILYHYYCDSEFDEQITDPRIEEVNINQVYNQYRSKYHLPFPDEIKEIRDRYDISPSRMSILLGFGINTYKNYENGEVPSESNAKLIQLAKDPRSFRNIITLNHDFSKRINEKLVRKIDELILEDEKQQQSTFIIKYIFGKDQPDEFSGFRSGNIVLMTEMVVYFTEKLRPHKATLNKLLFYADFLQYKKSCYSISGAKYHNIENVGPTPDNSNTLFEYIYNNKDVDIEFDWKDKIPCERFSPVRECRKNLFNVSQLETMDNVVKSFLKNDKQHDVHSKFTDKTDKTSSYEHISYNLGFELSI